MSTLCNITASAVSELGSENYFSRASSSTTSWIDSALR